MTKTVAPSRILYLQNVAAPLPLAESLLALTPKVSVVEKDLYLDIAPTIKFFGSEEKLLAELDSLLIALKLRPKIVLTDRIEQARALCIKDRNIFSQGDSQPFIPSLPIDSLFFFGDPTQVANETKARRELIEFMKRVGIFYLRDFLKIPATSINRRFGKLAMDLRSWILGEKESCLPLFMPDDRIQKSLLTDSLHSLDAVLFEIRHALIEIEARLWGRARLAKTILFRFRLESSKSVEERVSPAQPTRDPNTLLRLLRELLKDVSWDSPLSALEIEILETVPYAAGQLSLWDDKETRFTQMGEYLSRLRIRFGENNVGFAALQEDFLPERSWKCIWPPKPETIPYPILQRPSFIFSPPRPFPFRLNGSWSFRKKFSWILGTGPFVESISLPPI